MRECRFAQLERAHHHHHHHAEHSSQQQQQFVRRKPQKRPGQVEAISRDWISDRAAIRADCPLGPTARLMLFALWPRTGAC